MNAVLLVRDKQSFIPHGIRTSVLMDSHVTDTVMRRREDMLLEFTLF